MLKKVLSLMIVGIISIGLIGCDNSSNPKVEDNVKKPSKQDILFGNVEKDEDGNYILDISYDEAKNKSIETCNELIEFTKGKFDSDITIPEKAMINGDNINVQFKEDRSFSTGELSFNVDRMTLGFYYSAKIDCKLDNFEFDNYNLVKTQLEWFIDKGYNIDLQEVEKKINEKLLPEIEGLLGKAQGLELIEAERIEIPIDNLTSITIGGWENNTVSGLPDAKVVINISTQNLFFKE